MPIFDEPFLERLRATIDIRDIVGGYLTLKERRPGDWWGLCPFHQEKSPSFHILTDRGMFHCFGCHRGGNVINFIMEVERLTFYEAVKLLAEKAGLELPKTGFEKNRKTASEAELFISANQAALEFFHNRLITPHPTREALAARKYLEVRGISLEIIKEYRIGWAENSWDALLKWCAARNISGATLERAGLALRRRSGSGFVDRFRARIMFPIFSLAGKPVAFGGRKLEGVTAAEDDAKYVNTSDTPVYRKGEHLYGLFTARDAIRRAGFAFIAEGYTDLMALINAGAVNSVAALGTSVTAQQLRLLKRFAETIRIVFDGDDAGVAAALRLGDIAIQEGLVPMFIRLPNGDDPDSVLQRQGRDKLAQMLDNPLTLVQFHIAAAGIHHNLSPTERLNVAKGVLRTAARITDPLRRESLIRELSQSIHLSVETLDKALSGIQIEATSDEPVAEGRNPTFNNDQIVERDLMRELIAHPHLVELIVNQITPDDFTHPGLREIFKYIEKSYIRGIKIDAFGLTSNVADDAMRSFVAECIAQEHNEETAREALKACAVGLRNRRIARERKAIEMELHRAQNEGRPTRDLLKKLIELKA